MPTVSVIIPAQNRPVMLAEAIESALAQTFRDLEIIVVLNEATFETAEVARSFAFKSDIRIVEIGHSTLAAARNAGVKQARGEWLAFLDDDDLWAPEKIAMQLDAAKKYQSDLVTCEGTYFNNHGDIGGSARDTMPKGLDFREALMVNNCVSGGSSAIARTSVIRSLGGFDETLVTCEDWDMWRRVSWSHRIHCIDRILVRYRRHNANLSGRSDAMLIGRAQLFAKTLADTPNNLRHMIKAAQLDYYLVLRDMLTMSQTIRLHQTTPWHHPTLRRIVKFLTFGLLRRARNIAIRRSGATSR